MWLERGVCLCAELQVFSCYKDSKESCQATREITTSSPELSSRIFLAMQGAEGNSCHSDRNIKANAEMFPKIPSCQYMLLI